MPLFGPKTNSQQVGTADQPPRGPGAQLVEARERWGMSREQVANTLRLQPSVIAALEEEHYEGLPPPAFVRGYLSGYARLVGLDPEKLVAACEMRGCGDPALAAKHSLILKKGRGEKLIRWGSYAALGAFLSSAMFYWSDREQELQTLAPATIAEPAAEIATAPENKTAPLDAAVIDAIHAAHAATSGTNIADRLKQPKPALQPSPSGFSSASATTHSRDQHTEVPAENTWPTLELKFNGDSWLAVRDADGNRLAWETVKSGSRRQLRGAPPLRVVLGNAEAVHITRAGEKFDLTPFITGRIARFSVE